MTEAKGTDGRRERSRRTRAQIVDAAAHLFLEQGYVATTIDTVAEHAGVAVQTVYYVFGNKRNLLTAVLDTSIAGDADPVAVLDRAWVRSIGAQNDSISAMETLVEAMVAILARAAPVYEVVRRAAADPEVGELLTEARRGRRADQRGIAEILRSSNHLRADVDVDTAADVLYGLMSEEVFQLLTGDCGWSVDRFRRWATRLLVRELAPSDDARAHRSQALRPTKTTRAPGTRRRPAR